MLSLEDVLGTLGTPWGWETGPREVWAVVPVHLCRLQNNMKFLLPGQLTTFAQVSKQMNNNWSPFHMEPELPSQRACPARLVLTPLDVKTGQSSLGPGPTATLCPKELFVKMKRMQISWLLV